MHIRLLDPHDGPAARRWYAARTAGLTADLEEPITEEESALLASMRTNDSNPHTFRQAWGAWDDAECIGTVMLDLRRRDNVHLATVTLAVPPEARRRGIGAALFGIVRDEAAAAGRTVLTAEVSTRVAEDLPVTPGGRFAAARGGVVTHTERRSLVGVPFTDEALRGLEAAAAERGTGYRTVGWTGVAPPDLLDTYARLNTLMQRDVPHPPDREPPSYDAESLRAADQRLVDQGYGLVTTVVLAPGGGPVAYTTVCVLSGAGVDAIQENTFVLRAHRGRRLACLAKVANLRLLRASYPLARRLHTYTSDTNAPMRAINDRFGFRAVETTHTVEAPVRSPFGP
jgi:GNAT superfamily N-acetyltransferase